VSRGAPGLSIKKVKKIRDALRARKWTNVCESSRVRMEHGF